MCTATIPGLPSVGLLHLPVSVVMALSRMVRSAIAVRTAPTIPAASTAGLWMARNVAVAVTVADLDAAKVVRIAAH